MRKNLPQTLALVVQVVQAVLQRFSFLEEVALVLFEESYLFLCLHLRISIDWELRVELFGLWENFGN